MESWAEQVQKKRSIVPPETLCYKFDNSQLLTACWLACAHTAPLCSRCLCRAFATQVIFPTKHCGEQCKLFSPHKSKFMCMLRFSTVWDTLHLPKKPDITCPPAYVFLCFILIRLLYFKSKAKCFPNVGRIWEVGFFFPLALNAQAMDYCKLEGGREKIPTFPVLGPQDEEIKGHPIQAHKHFQQNEGILMAFQDKHTITIMD